MANRDHPIRVTDGDTVLMASSLIPGNENAIYRVINELTRWGANVVHKGNAKVHVSGHASAGELAYCYNIIKPRNVLPVHGEWRHLRANADIAIRTGIHPKNTLIAEDGSVIDLVKGRATITGTVPAGLVFVDGTDVGGTTEESLHVRRTLAEEGVLTIICIVDPDTGKVAEEPDYLAHGFAPDAMDFDNATPAIQKALIKASREGIEDLEQIEDLVPAGGVHLGPPQAPPQPADHPRHRRRLTLLVAGRCFSLPAPGRHHSRWCRSGAGDHSWPHGGDARNHHPDEQPRRGTRDGFSIAGDAMTRVLIVEDEGGLRRVLTGAPHAH